MTDRPGLFAWVWLLASAGMIAYALYSLAQAMAEPPPLFLDSRYPALARSQHVQSDLISVVAPLFAGAVLAGVAYFMAIPTSPIRRYGLCRYSLAWLAVVAILAAVVGKVFHGG